MVKIGLLLTYVDEATNDIFGILPNNGNDYATAVASSERFDPARNKDMEIYDFPQIVQTSGETRHEFHRRLKEKANTCEFNNEEAEIRTQILHKTSDSRLRRKALREEMNLEALLKYGLALEKSDLHNKLLEEGQRSSNSHQTNFVREKAAKQRKTAYGYGENNNRHSLRRISTAQRCRNCGGSYPHLGGKFSCPAAGKKCYNCEKIGHFSKHCLSAPRRQNQLPRYKDNRKPTKDTRVQNGEKRRRKESCARNHRTGQRIPLRYGRRIYIHNHRLEETTRSDNQNRRRACQSYFRYWIISKHP